MTYEGRIEAVYVQPESEGVEECVIVQVAGGPKTYMRLWPSTQSVEWGWTLHPSALLTWMAPDASSPSP